MRQRKWHVGDRVRLEVDESYVKGTVTSVSAQGHLGVAWDDGIVTEPNGLDWRDALPANPVAPYGAPTSTSKGALVAARRRR